jgi:K(+)-stimulated pyrophosphate-energized sodium pump
MHGGSVFEVIAIWSVLGTAFAGLIYAVFLTLQILRADQGNEKMRKIAKAIRIGANTYLNRQFRTIVFIVGLLTVLLYFTTTQGFFIALGRAGAFLMGSIFSALVGYIGMNMAIVEMCVLRQLHEGVLPKPSRLPIVQEQ